MESNYNEYAIILIGIIVGILMTMVVKQGQEIHKLKELLNRRLPPKSDTDMEESSNPNE